jgi:WD40 repeat protein
LLASAGRWNGDVSGSGAVIWDAQTGKQLRTITNESNGGTHAVVFSPTGNVVAIGSRQFDKTNDTSTTTVSLTNAISGITEWQQTMPGWAKPGGFSPDGKSLVRHRDGSRKARNTIG